MRAGLALMLTMVVCQAGVAEDNRNATVGMSAAIDQIVLPGAELEAKPLDDSHSPIVLRVAGSYPHGSDFRYDLVYYGLEPGAFNLVDFLRRKDDSTTDDLPPITVEIKSVLPPGQVQPNQLESRAVPYLGGYQTWLAVGGTVWFFGIFVILFAWRKKADGEQHVAEEHLSLADRLRPMVQGAMNGNLDDTGKAELERMLLAFWRRRLDLEELEAMEAIDRLRQHDEAGDLLRQLELWLHRPGPSDDVDITELLKPYEAVDQTRV